MYVRIYICIYIHACMYVCMYVCIHVCMYVFMYVCMYVCIYKDIDIQFFEGGADLLEAFAVHPLGGQHPPRRNGADHLGREHRVCLGESGFGWLKGDGRQV